MEILDGDTWLHRDVPDQAKNVEELYAKHEGVERLRREIGCLRPSLRIVVEIHQSNDRSIKEVAELAGLSVAATKSRLGRARKILREALRETSLSRGIRAAAQSVAEKDEVRPKKGKRSHPRRSTTWMH
jgi:DNA-directed RNA polymerase specialized sigma24 family protein